MIAFRGGADFVAHVSQKGRLDAVCILRAGEGVADGVGAQRNGVFEFRVEPLQGKLTPPELELQAHTRAHHGEVDRLMDEIHGPGLQCPRLAIRIIFGGHEDQRYSPAGRAGFEDLADCIAVHLRHHDIEQNQIRLGLLHQCQRFSA